MHNRQFRVIIGGGGISGLTLANALEKCGIDYILLESRNTITPQVGASIGLFPNGSRIIDQLGCYDSIEKQIVPLGNYHSRYANGNIIYVDDGSRLSQMRYVTPKSHLLYRACAPSRPQKADSRLTYSSE
jgi:2-polyprenyl-6-methoxyphenol hydroxylase-like FAD-dependent oxidoreductase